MQAAGRGISVSPLSSIRGPCSRDVARISLGGRPQPMKRSIQAGGVRPGACSLKAGAGPGLTAAQGRPPGSPWGHLAACSSNLAVSSLQGWPGPDRQAGPGVCQANPDQGTRRRRSISAISSVAERTTSSRRWRARGFRLSLINRQWETASPRPTGPRSWCSWARAEAIGHDSITITLGLRAHPTPTSTTRGGHEHIGARQRRRWIAACLSWLSIAAMSRPTRRSAAPRR